GTGGEPGRGHQPLGPHRRGDGDRAAHARGLGIGRGQHHPRVRQARHPRLLRRRRLHRVQGRQLRPDDADGRGRGHGGSLERVLLLYRLRRRLDCRRGGEEPPPRPAAGDHPLDADRDLDVRALAVTAIGARRWQWFETAQAPLVQIVEEISGSNLAVLLFAVAAVLAIFSVVITVLYGQSRILLTMSRDGMVPKIFGLVSRRTATPLAGTLIIGGLLAMTAALLPLGELADATSIGTLFAFFLVNLAVIYLRFQRPDLERSFKVPFGPVVPALGALACAFLMINLGGTT